MDTDTPNCDRHPFTLIADVQAVLEPALRAQTFARVHGREAVIRWCEEHAAFHVETRQGA
jgi:hypothetical protein